MENHSNHRTEMADKSCIGERDKSRIKNRMCKLALRNMTETSEENLYVDIRA